MATVYGKPIIIVVSGVPGSGKSTLVEEAATTLGQAAILHFDDYGATSIYPEDMKSWALSAGDPNDWQTPQLVEDLRSLRSGVAVLHPRTQILIEPQPVILVEEPFGRSREAMNALVDLVVHISLPFDIALIRLMRRMLLEDSNSVESERQGCSQVLEGLFRLYLENGMREMFQYTDKLAGNSADLILDGMEAPQSLTSELLEATRNHYDSPEFS